MVSILHVAGFGAQGGTRSIVFGGPCRSTGEKYCTFPAKKRSGHPVRTYYHIAGYSPKYVEEGVLRTSCSISITSTRSAVVITDSDLSLNDLSAHI